MRVIDVLPRLLLGLLFDRCAENPGEPQESQRQADVSLEKAGVWDARTQYYPLWFRQGFLPDIVDTDSS